MTPLTLDTHSTAHGAKSLRIDSPPAVEAPVLRSGETTTSAPGTLPSLSLSRDRGITLSVSDTQGEGSSWAPPRVAQVAAQILGFTRAEKANRDRLILLSRQFVQRELAAEEAARLAIATERVDDAFPRYSRADFATLEREEQAAAEFEARLQRRRAQRRD